MREPKKDCFAYKVSGCSILTETVCRKRNCTFYKTKEQARADAEKYPWNRKCANHSGK